MATCTRLNRLLTAVWIIVAVLAGSGIGVQLVTLLPTFGQTTTWESATLAIAWQVRSGETAYRPIGPDSLYVAIYGPAYFYLLGAVGWLLDADRAGLVAIARGYSVISFGAAVLCVAWLSRRADGRRWAPLAVLPVIGVFTLTMVCFVASSRPDTAATFWSLLAILLARKARWSAVIAAAFLVLVAILHKQTAIAAPLAIALWLAMQGHWRRAVSFALIAAAGLAGIVLAINAATDGRFLAHQQLVGWVPMRVQFGWAILEGGNLGWIMLFLAAVGLVAADHARLHWKDDPTLALGVLYMICSLVIGLVTVCRGGSGPNYFFDFFLAAGWCAAMIVGKRQARPSSAFTPTQYAISLLLLANPFLWLMPVRADRAAGLRGSLDGIWGDLRQDADWLRRQPGPVLCLDPWLAYWAGVDGHLADPTMYAFLTYAHPEWDPLSPRIEQRRFATVVLFGTTTFAEKQRYQGVPSFPPQLLAALRAHYWPGEVQDYWHAYHPRELARQRLAPSVAHATLWRTHAGGPGQTEVGAEPS